MRQFILFLLLIHLPPGITLADDAAKTFQQRVSPILKAACTNCHGGSSPEAGLGLGGNPTIDELSTSYHHWFKVADQVEIETMPPEGEGTLDAKDKQTLLGWIRGDLTNLLVARQRKEGRSKLRRLSRNEYANTVQDIFGIRPPVKKLMPC